MKIKCNSFIKYFLFFLSFSVCAKEKIKSFTLENSIPVYVNLDSSSHFTSLSVIVSGGINYYSKEESGLEDAVFNMITSGSKKYSYSDLQDFYYRTGSSISSRTVKNGSVYIMNSIDYYFDETFDVFEDGFFSPLFEKKEFDNLKKSYELSIQNMLNSPVDLLVYYASQLIYENHPYSVSAKVQPESIKNITLEKVKEFYPSVLDSRRICIVASGNFDFKKLIDLLNRKFSKIPALKSELKNQVIEPVEVSGENAVFIHPTAEGSGEVIRFFKAPLTVDDDFFDFEIASKMYSDVLFNVVREHFGDCYTPSSSSTGGKAPLGYEMLSSVSNLKDFAKHTKIARDIMSGGNVVSGKDKKGNFITEPVSSRLKSYVNSYINSVYASSQTVYSLNLRLSYSYLNYQDVEKSDELFQRIYDVTPEGVLSAFNKYFVNESSRWFCVVGENEEDSVYFE